ncbi:MAG: cytochrome ubiquinol oxidase subunit I [Verrucomicrobiota bacterium]|nr:cytochrome ubiquinol oxidase subunit I [Verrucomicrobiota bacterium]
MDVLTLSRIQFAINSCFHYLYPPISIGLGLMLVIMEGLYLKRGDHKYKEMTSFWINIFALTFALGVATGLVQTFAFGTNWARYSRFVGDVFGSALAAEGIFAFFLESGFLGILLFGWNRVGPKLHYFATICVALGAHFSAVWILVANSWMQTPAGFHIENSPTGPRAVISNFWEMVFNPSTVDRIFHVLIGCWLTGAFLVLSVAAYYFLRGKHKAISRSMMRIGLLIAFICCLLQLFSGDRSARLIAKYQPSKFAAFEGVYKTEKSTPISVIGWVDAKEEKVHSIAIPGALNLLTYRDLSTPVAGLDQVPRDEWPNVPVVFQTYHLMVLMWSLMFFISSMGLWSWWRGTLEKKRWLLWAMVFSVAAPHIAQQAGWISTEMGRQPWIVWKVLRTADGVSQSIVAGQVVGSIIMFICVYLLLFALFLFLLDRKIKHGPEEVRGDQIYQKQQEGFGA